MLADGQQLGHVFMNIIINAAQAMSCSGTITITTGESASKERVIIEITDTGPGISARIWSIFSNLFLPPRTKAREPDWG